MPRSGNVSPEDIENLVLKAKQAPSTKSDRLWVVHIPIPGDILVSVWDLQAAQRRGYETSSPPWYGPFTGSELAEFLRGYQQLVGCGRLVVDFNF